MLAFVMVPLSGCIEADEFYSQMEDEYDSWNQGHEKTPQYHEDEWEEDCPEEEDEDQSSGHEYSRPQRQRDDEYEDAYADADYRYNNHVDGDEDSRRTITVDWRDDDMRIALKYDLDGDIDFRLRNPLGVTVAKESFDGEKEMDEDEWYTVENPMPGDWRLTIEIDGDGAYALGVYLDD